MPQSEEIDAFVDEAGKSITKENPLKLVGGVENHFLPRIELVVEFFGLNVSAKAIYDRLKAENSNIPKISSSSLHEMGRNGVGRATFKKLIKILPIFHLKLLPFINVYDLLLGQDKFLKRSFNSGSNATAWLLVTRLVDRCLEDVSVYRYVSDFIFQRCQQDIALTERQKLKLEKKKVTGETRFLLWHTEIRPLYQQHTQISSDTLEQLGEMIKNNGALSSSSLESKESFIYQMLEVKYDFLFSCIACYEVAFIKQPHIPDRYDKWFISQALEAYSQTDSNRTCFRCLMDVLVEYLSTEGIKLTQSELASCVPLKPYVNYDAEDKLLAQQNKLNKWYRSIDLPSSSGLIEFIKNLSELFEQPWSIVLNDVVRISIGLDKALITHEKSFKAEFGNDVDVLTIWKKVMGNYVKYFEHHKERYSKYKPK